MVAILLFSALIFSCDKDDDTSPNTVSIGDDVFSPGTITVDMGTTITWTNNGADWHTVTSDGAVFDSGTMDPGDTYSRTFNTAGTFPYHCENHIGMNGTVIVN